MSTALNTGYVIHDQGLVTFSDFLTLVKATRRGKGHHWQLTKWNAPYLEEDYVFVWAWTLLENQSLDILLQKSYTYLNGHLAVTHQSEVCTGKHSKQVSLISISPHLQTISASEELLSFLLFTLMTLQVLAKVWLIAVRPDNVTTVNTIHPDTVCLSLTSTAWATP